MRKPGVAALALCLSFASSTAFAVDYPFSGFFTFTPPSETPEKSKLYCGYSVFIQGKDGTYVSYHLDLPRFVAGGSVKFVEYGRGICTVAAGAQVEICTATSDTDPEVQGKTYYDVFRQGEAGVIDLFFFDTVAAAQAFAAEGAGSREPDSRYVRCGGFDAAGMAGYLSADRSSLSPADRLKMITPEMNDATMAIMTRVLETIRADKKE